jgi:anthranilate synthase component 1
MISPSFDEFKNLSNFGNLIPLYEEIHYDLETPISLFAKFINDKPSFLLESVEGGDKWARYSFIGLKPSLVFRSKNSRFELIKDGIVLKTGIEKDPLRILKLILNQYRPIQYDSLPRFFGGAVGYISYDYVRSIERIPELCSPNHDFYDCYFMITDTLIVFDNLRHKLILIANVFLDEKSDSEKLYKEASERFEDLIKVLKNNTTSPPVSKKSTLVPTIYSHTRKENFIEMVKKAKSYIINGDIIQVVLSQRFVADIHCHPFDIYRALRSINPSPYLFYLNLEDSIILGSSPEVMVRLEGKKIELRPIAGTRPRGKTPEEDVDMEKELLSDEKERAEHIMLVDLGRNDIGRVSEIGSVKVNEFMTVERYSHVMHIVSNIEGRLSQGKDAFDLLRATFPAGTVSGAPKIRAMEIIEELEPQRRGPYAGAVGYFSFSGNMDTCITIRSILIKGNKAYIQTGAGIVADSDPEMEYEETLNKAKALFKAIKVAEEGML